MSEIDNQPPDDSPGQGDDFGVEPIGSGERHKLMVVFVLVVGFLIAIVIVYMGVDDDAPVSSIDSVPVETDKERDEKISRGVTSKTPNFLVPKTPVKQVGEPSPSDVDLQAKRTQNQSNANLRVTRLLIEREKADKARKEQEALQKRMAVRKKASSLIKSNNQLETSGSTRAEGNSRNQYLETLKESFGSLAGGVNVNNTPVDTSDVKVDSSDAIKAKLLPDIHFLIPEGTVIQATMETAINSDLQGKVRAIVSEPVWSYSGSKLLIPQFSKIVGEYGSGVLTGQSRLMIIWTRILTPRGISISINSPGADQLGRSGMEGETDNHFLKRFGSSVLLTLISGAAQRKSDNDLQSQAISDSFNRSSEIALKDSVNISPTITINQGDPVVVFVARDMDFKSAYQVVHKVDKLARRRQRVIYNTNLYANQSLPPANLQKLQKEVITDLKKRKDLPAEHRAYTAKKSDSLKSTIEYWASLNEYHLEWDVKDFEEQELDWMLPVDLYFNGTFYNAIDKLLGSYTNNNQSSLNFEHYFYENNVLHVLLRTDVI